MELPIAPQSYLPGTDALVRAVKRAAIIRARMVSEEASLDAATVFVRPDRPGDPLANRAFDLRLPDGQTADSVLAAVLDAFATRPAACRVLDCNDTVWPAALAQAVEARGYLADDRRVLLLRDYRRPEPIDPTLQVLPGRAVYPALRVFWQESVGEQLGVSGEAARHAAQSLIDHLDEPRVDPFVARRRGRLVGMLLVINLGNIGVIDGLYTAPAHRRTRVAATLLAHALDHCSRSLFEHVILDVASEHPALPWLQRLGFQSAAQHRRYLRND